MKRGNVHKLYKNGLATLCEKDPARVRWTPEWGQVTCRRCLRFKPSPANVPEEQPAGVTTVEDRLRAALAEREAYLALCPMLRRGARVDKCPECDSTTAGPCWRNVRADAAFVDTVKEIVA